MYQPVKTFRWFRFGDLNMENGGGFYSFEGWPHYIDIIRVTPCSDAGGPDNQFWIERGSLFMERSKEDFERALAMIGMDDADEWRRLSRATKRHAKTQAVLGYYGMDRDSHWTIQIGAKAEPCSSSFTTLIPDYVLRGNCSLENYIYENRF